MKNLGGLPKQRSRPMLVEMARRSRMRASSTERALVIMAAVAGVGAVGYFAAGFRGRHMLMFAIGLSALASGVLLYAVGEGLGYLRRIEAALLRAEATRAAEASAEEVETGHHR